MSFLITICLGSNLSLAQLIPTNSRQSEFTNKQKNKADSLKKSALTDDRISIYLFSAKDSSKQKLDTTIRYLNRSVLLNDWEYDLGNFGTASTSLLFNPNLSASRKLCVQSSSSTLFTWENTKFYNTTRPYSNIYYKLGTKQEQMIHLLHTQNITPRWNMAVSYRKINSPGFFKYQNFTSDQFCVSSNYRSQNLRYKALSALNYNKVQQDENGGILSSDYLLDSRYNDRRLVPVVNEGSLNSKNKSSMKNYLRTTNFTFSHEYDFGKKDSMLSVDSSEKIYTFKPIFGIKHILYEEAERAIFKDASPDSTFYYVLGNYEFKSIDSIYSRSFYRRFGNAFSLLGNISIRQQVLQAEAGYGIELERLRLSSAPKNYINSYLFASINKSANDMQQWFYNAYFKLYVTGNAIGNLQLQGMAGRKLKAQLGNVTIGFNQSLQTADYVSNYYQTNHFILEASTKKQTITKLHFLYQNEPLKASVLFNYYMIANWIYRDTNLLVKQYAPLIPITQLKIYKEFVYRNCHLGTDLLFQFASIASPIHIPLLATNSRLSYENFIFKKKLQIATGFDLKYNLPYYADDYSPINYAFVTQYNTKISNVPRISFFFNFKVKRFRASLSLDELQQFYSMNALNASFYPAQNFIFHFGLHWAFVN